MRQVAGIIVPELQLAGFGDSEQSAVGIDDSVDAILLDDQALRNLVRDIDTEATK